MAMDICVVPHSNEFRSPIKLFEVMARGRAVLAPRTEPIAMLVSDGGNGALFDHENPAALRGALTRRSPTPRSARASVSSRGPTCARITLGGGTQKPYWNASVPEQAAARI